MYYLIYVSYSSHEMGDSDLKDILTECHAKNTAKGITGMLLYIDGKFIQVLEGDKDDVIDIYEAIHDDERHKKVSVILEGDLEERNYSEWSMGFKANNLEEFRKESAYRQLDNLFAFPASVNNHPALSFMRLFYEKNYAHNTLSAKAS